MWGFFFILLCGVYFVEFQLCNMDYILIVTHVKNEFKTFSLGSNKIQNETENTYIFMMTDNFSYLLLGL